MAYIVNDLKNQRCFKTCFKIVVKLTTAIYHNIQGIFNSMLARATFQ